MTYNLNQNKIWACLVLFVLLCTQAIAQSNAQRDFDKAQQFYQQGKPDSALYFLRAAKTGFEATLSFRKQNQVLISFSKVFGRLSQMDSAIFYAEEAVRFSKMRFGSADVAYGKALHNQVGLFITLGSPDRARPGLEKAMEIFEKEDSEDETMAKLYHEWGSVYLLEGKPDMALRAYEESLKRSVSIYGEQHMEVVSAYESIGVIYAQQYYFEKALESLENAIQIVEAIAGPNHPKLARSLSNAANVHTMIGNTAMAIEHLQRALVIMKQAFPENHPNIGLILLNIGVVYLYQGEYEPARTYLYKALAIQEKALGPNHYLPATTINNLGMVEMGDGNYKLAQGLINKALHQRERIFGKQHPEVANTLMNLGELSIKQKDAEGLAHLQRALAIRTALTGTEGPQVAETYNAIGDLHFEIGAFANAKSAYQKALTINLPDYNKEKPKVLESTIMASHSGILLHSLGQLAITISKTPESREKRGDMTEAVNLFKLCDSLVVQSRRERQLHEDKLRLGETSRHIYNEAVALCFDLFASSRDDKYLEEAFYFMEKSKASLLSETLAEEATKRFSGLPADLLAYEKELVSQLAYNRSQLVEMPNASPKYQAVLEQVFTSNQKLDSLIQVLEKEYPRYHDLKYKRLIVSVEGLKSELKSSEAVINYHEADDEIFVLAIHSQGIDGHRLVKGEELEEALNDFLRVLAPTGENLSDPQAFKSYNTAAYELFSQLVAPVIGGKSANIDHLKVVPSGRFTYLPFELMISKALDSSALPHFQNTNYLIKDFTISYAYAASLWSGNQAVAKAKPTVLAMAPAYAEVGADEVAVQMANTRWYRGPLSWNQEEVTNINEYFDGEYLIGASATEASFKAKSAQHDVLHMAMHALINDEAPTSSSLLFAKASDEKEDGLLYTYELYGMDLPVDMVVLSACNTGLGKVREGEGMMSLGRAVAYAGCPSIVTSYWAVDDRATAQLMSLFYSELAAGQSKHDALRNAKLQYLQKARGVAAHPYYWGSFVLFGEETPIVAERSTTWLYWGLGLLIVLIIGRAYRKKRAQAS